MVLLSSTPARLPSRDTVRVCKGSRSHEILCLCAVFTLFLCAICLRRSSTATQCSPLIITSPIPMPPLEKEVTLSVSSLNRRNEEPPEDGLRQLDAQTFNQHKNGGTLMVLAPPAIAASLIQLCGTNRSTKVGSKVTMIHAVFSQEKTGPRRYYLLFAPAAD